MAQSITSKDFQRAKKAVKKIGVADYAMAHRVAMDDLKANCPSANIELIADMAWEIVKAARNK